MNPELKNTVNGAWMPTIVFEKKINITQEKLLKAFAKENIDARVFFWPLSKLKMFKPVKKILTLGIFLTEQLIFQVITIFL